jgi:DNA-binding CsgD family transcriptional regulator
VTIDAKLRAVPSALENDVAELVNRLAAEARVKPPRLPNLITPDGQEVVLDVEVEGFRCILLRLQPPGHGDDPSLSPREHEIARMVAKGYANKTIATVLDISSWTVGTYLRRIFAKLGVSSRAAMVARLLERGTLNRTPNESPEKSDWPRRKC